MSETVIQVEGLSKKYQLGTIGYGSLRHDLQAWWARVRGKEDPNAMVWGKSRLDLHGDFWALRNLTFDVSQGDRVGIIGRNGAGKSTLLKVLSRITTPTEGVVRMKGKVASLLEVGTGFHPELTGRENVYLNGAIMGMKQREIDSKFDEIVTFAGVEQFIDTPVKRYSSGMYVRLGFAVAAHMDPDILVVDEVLSVGDAAFQEKCLGKMEEVSSQGRTVLFVSHNMLSVQNFCRRGILLDTGRIERDDDIAGVVAHYLGKTTERTGEVAWATTETAPGDGRARLKAVRVVSNTKTTGEVIFENGFQIEADFWNLEQGSRRLISFHIVNSMGITVLTTGNFPSVSLEPDPWFERKYPRGIFRSTCTIPCSLLNEGLYSISVYINETTAYDNILIAKDILSFSIVDGGSMRKEYTGPWLGIIRPRLAWRTQQIE